MEKARIVRVTGCEILDSRGNPTVAAEVKLTDGSIGRSAVPSGASTGSHEAHERRDKEKRYDGLGVRAAVDAVNTVLFEAVRNREAEDQAALDAALCAADGTVQKNNLGANALLGVSLAAARAAAVSRGMPFWRYLALREGTTPHLPRPMLNILNGGVHAPNNVDIQEFMVVPLWAPTFAEGLERCVRIYHALGRLLSERGLSCGVGDEGGFAPRLQHDEEALDLILSAIEACGLRPGVDAALALDAAASGWREENGMYRLPKSGRLYSPDELAEYWSGLAGRYPILSLEDPAAEDDWALWERLTGDLGEKIQLVGDDLFVTQTERLWMGIGRKAANAILIKPNQVGTLTETLEAVSLARQHGFGVVLSHRSGETEDSILADLAVGTGCGQIKAGAPCRGERTAKYNRLLMIEAELAKENESDNA